MSTDGQPKKPEAGVPDWPGRRQGVPRPPTPLEVDEVASQQEIITDEWAPASPAKTVANPPETAGHDG